MDASTREFSESALDPLVAGQLRDDPVILIATRGTDESGVEATVETLRNAGASVVGILWLDERTDPAGSDDVMTRLATFLGLKPDLSAAKRADTSNAITSRLVSLLVTPLSDAAAAPAGLARRRRHRRAAAATSPPWSSDSSLPTSWTGRAPRVTAPRCRRFPVRGYAC